MENEQLPLLDLFTRLQKAGISLGLADYQLILEAIQNGFGQPDREALKRLCLALWIKSDDDRSIFEFHFENTIRSLESASDQTSSTNESASQKTKQEVKQLQRLQSLARILRQISVGGFCIFGLLFLDAETPVHIRVENALIMQERYENLTDDNEGDEIEVDDDDEESPVDDDSAEPDSEDFEGEDFDGEDGSEVELEAVDITPVNLATNRVLVLGTLLLGCSGLALFLSTGVWQKLPTLRKKTTPY